MRLIMITIPLYKNDFTATKQRILHSAHFEVSRFIYPSGVHAIEIKNAKGHLVILPFMGQMIWDAHFLATNLCMKNMFTEPKPAQSIMATYGCFAFHAGMIRMGCPAPEDDHPLHGEMPCAAMDSAWLEVSDDCVTLKGSYEYVMGFGHHYLATPAVSLSKDASLFDIQMQIKNLATVPMPLQYMCHINTAYFGNGQLQQNIPASALTLRESIPAHVQPNAQWLEYNQQLKTAAPISELNTPALYDPEIVYFMDDLAKHIEQAQFKLDIGDKYLLTEFSTEAFNCATRWILYNGDQQVGAYVLPATCRPEGFLAAKANGTLIYLAPGQERHFNVRTGICLK